jgi:phosphotransferase system enzyme I (PtsP)
MILKDKRFIGDIRRLIENGTRPREAVRSVARKYITIFSESSHTYIREKVNDIEDLASRLLENMSQRSRPGSGRVTGHIVIARELYPSDVLKLASEDAAGIILVRGGATSHVAIISRSMGIPVVITQNRDLLKIPEGTPTVMDATDGHIHLSPGAALIREFEQTRKAREIEASSGDGMRPETRTRDGHRIRLMANINLLSELPAARRSGVEGVGLYRTEFPFLVRPEFPSEEEQVLIYRRLFEEIPQGPITIRTLDAGGEKMLAYSDTEIEANPELGLRSIRFSLRYRQVFEQQLRAVLRAAGGSDRLRIMFPMISSVDEFIEVRGVTNHCRSVLESEGFEVSRSVEVGAMIELPSTLAILDDLAAEADFFSIGTNDFIQFMLAADRSNELVANYYEPAHPSVLRGLAQVAACAGDRGVDVSVCGEMAHEPEFIPFLLGIGIRTFSADPQFLPAVQETIAATDLTAAGRYAEDLLGLATIKKIRSRISLGC